MKTIIFDCRGNNAPAYECNKPGDNSGEYVSAEVADDLYGALEALLETCHAEPHGEKERRAAKAALAKARGEA